MVYIAMASLHLNAKRKFVSKLWIRESMVQVTEKEVSLY